MPPKKNNNSTLLCYQCHQPVDTQVSHSEKNPGRPYYRCLTCPGSNGKSGLFLGFYGEYDGQPPARKKWPAPKPKKPVYESPEEDEEEEEKEEEEAPNNNKRKRVEESSSSSGSSSSQGTFNLGKYMNDKILQNTENSETILLELRRLAEGIDKLIASVENNTKKSE